MEITNLKTKAENVRKLVAVKQHLSADSQKKPVKDNIISTVRDMVYVQWDPIEVVAPSHLLTLWNRVSGLKRSDLDNLLWSERILFKHWVNMAACIVSVDDYRIYHSLMKRYPDSVGDPWRSQRESARKFISTHRELSKSILKQLENNPMQVGEFKEYVKTKRADDGWSPGSPVVKMLGQLEMGGKVMVVGQDGLQNIWGLPEEHLDVDFNEPLLAVDELEKICAMRAISALGTATSPEINFYFPRGRYRGLEVAIEKLLEESLIERISVEGIKDRTDRYILREDVDLLLSLEDKNVGQQISLLPPFDNLTRGRDRTNKVFGFDYNLEMFLPKDKRKYGYYVLSVLSGSELIGRIDPFLDKENKRLTVNAVYAEPGAPEDKETAMRIADKIESLALFLGAEEVIYGPKVPLGWKGALH